MTGKKTTEQDGATGADPEEVSASKTASEPATEVDPDKSATVTDEVAQNIMPVTEETTEDDSEVDAEELAPTDACLPDEEAVLEEPSPEESLQDQAPKTNLERPGSETATVPQNVETVVERRGGFVPALLGGVIAAILGFAAARSELLDPILPDSWRSSDNSEVLAAVQATLTEQGSQLGALGDTVASIEIPDPAPLTARIDELGSEIEPIRAQIADMQTALSDIRARLDEVEKRPISEGVSQSAIEAYERELDRLREAVTEQRSEVEALISEARELDAQAEESARAATAQAVLARLQSALDDGAAYPDLIEELGAAGVEVPADLQVNAGGVPTLVSLQTAFPDAARAALADTREATGDTGGLGAFLQRQLGARSVEPREGDDADAILSRAEADVAAGQLQKALDELSALPDTAKPALAEWIDDAQRRVAAKEAATALMQSQSGN